MGAFLTTPNPAEAYSLNPLSPVSRLPTECLAIDDLKEN